MRIDLTDPDLFASNAFWPAFAWLRANDPVHRHPEPGGSGFWVVTKHADVGAVYADASAFSSRYGMNLGSDPAAVAAVSQRMLIVSDPPDHTCLKRVLSRSFAADRMAEIEALARLAVADVLDAALEQAADPAGIDFIEIAKAVPNRVICALMGLPRADWELVGQIVTDAFEADDEEVRAAAHGEIFLLFSELLAGRRAAPGTDFVSEIATGRRATAVPGQDRLLTDEEIVFNCNGVLAGGNETTRYSAAGGTLALITHPSQWALLRAGAPEIVAPAVEEILRWTVPGVHALRTAVRPATIRGTRIEAGDRVTLWNVSANRDEEVFLDADEFRIDRTPNRHVTFGQGRHLCLGSRLARLELSALFSGLAARVSRIELAGEPVYNASNFTWGLRSLPIRLVPVARPTGRVTLHG